MTLNGKKIAILIAARGTEEPEFSQPKAAVENAGGSVTVIGAQTGTAETVNGDLDPGETYTIDRAVTDVSADEFDALVIPGGVVGSDSLRASEDVVAFVRAFFAQKKPVGAICHAPWVLIEAGVLDGRHLTSFPTLQTDLRNAGARWSDEEVVTDQGLVTSRTPDDLPAFCDKIVEEFDEGKHAAQARSV